MFSRVYLMNGCNTSTGESVLILCLILSLISGWIMKHLVLPHLFGEAWGTFSSLKQRKLVAYLVKINVRVSMLVMLGLWVFHDFSMSDGLFARSNIKAAWQQLLGGELVTCEVLQERVVHGLRAWTMLRNAFLSLMLWEICYIPEMGFEMWAHHGVIICFTVLSLDPILWAGLTQLQPILDGLTFFGMIGGGLLSTQEICVLGYHLSAPNAARQACWMQAAWIFQAVIASALFFLLPLTLLWMHAAFLGVELFVCLAGLLALSGAEVQMVCIKQAVVRHARQKLVQRSLDRTMLPSSA